MDKRIRHHFRPCMSLSKSTRTPNPEHPMEPKPETLIPKHGGYENTVTWQIADFIYEYTP